MGGFSPGWVKSQTVMISKELPPPLSPSKRNLAPTSVNPHKKKNTDLHHPSITNRENIKENGQFNKIVQNR